MPQGTGGARGSFAAALALTSLSTFVAMLAYSGPLGNAATVTAAVAAPSGATLWILSSMSTGLALSLLTAGALADQSGRRRVFTLGAWIFAAGSVVCATATTATQFVVGRVVEGVGAAGLIATGLGLVAAVTGDAAARSTAASWWGASMGLGIALGPLLTGLFDLVELWHVPYWLLAVSGAGIAVAARWCFSETAVIAGRRLDLLGAALLTGGLGLGLVALVETRQGGLAPALICGGGAVVTLVAFTISQFRGRSPMVDFGLFRRGDFVAATVAATATGAGVIALLSFACTFLVTSMGMTTFEASALLVLWSGTSAVSAVLSRGLAAWLGGTAQLAIGLGVTGVGLLLLTGLEVGSTGARLVPGLLVAGVATGVLNAGLGRQATATVPPERAAVGVGMNNTTRYVGASIGVTVVGVLAAAPAGDLAAQLSGWNHVAVLTGTLSLVGAAVVLALSRSASARTPG
ncbi:MULTISPECIES: MFS transporter [Prauserella salsuginis group]|uniref:MFS family permease n=2 Tax=Prauserella salsuginis group TaxID=2893672 RepID=A0A839XM05_9PSEU|nr:MULTISPECIES: MFS transporter [Prauserella salsuginis group]MBB3663781.1 MFS family permease [Prauserella sediminis]MCR3722439.1 Major Facilitator Superfamily protein [Prauserella flava]MCR3736881.1 Major Facilitator Superfamily protein [Prauserella salsuginis]